MFSNVTNLTEIQSDDFQKSTSEMSFEKWVPSEQVCAQVNDFFVSISQNLFWEKPHWRDINRVLLKSFCGQNAWETPG